MSLVVQEVLTCHFCNDPITKITGQDSDSLCNHHITYIPEVKVPAHIGCNVRYHRTHPDHPTDPTTEYRRGFIESLGGMASCYFCGEQITKMSGMESKSLFIHSLDGDHGNWEPTNKVPTHHGCHARYHAINISKCTRRKISISVQNTREEVWRKRRERYGPTGFKDPNCMRGENSPMYRNVEAAERGWDTRRERHGPSGYKGEHHMKRPEQRERFSRENPMKRPELKKGLSKRMKGDKNPMKDPDVAAKAWATRRERYGPSGGDYSRSWELRREKYDPSGGWELRRERYGPTGRKPK